MKVHVFKSGSKPNHFAFTNDRSGGNLPSAGAPWTYDRDVDVKAGQKGRIGASDDEILKEIAAKGFHVVAVAIETK